MKILIIALFTLFAVHASATDELKKEICTAFAEDNSGLITEWSDDKEKDVEVVYDYNLAFDYCMDVVEPVAKVDKSGTYYEFELFVCAGSYQVETIAFDPISKTLESLGGSGSGDECPYKLDK